MVTKLETIWRKSKKTVAGVTTSLLGWGAAVVVSDPAPITAAEWITFGTAVAVGLGVYHATNERG
jgi:hypothetical protein